MKKYFLIISIALMLCCNNRNEIDNKNNTVSYKRDYTNVDCGDFILKINIDSEDFKVVNNGNNIDIYKEQYGSIDEKEITIIEKENRVSHITVNEDIEIGIYQTLTDENPNSSIDLYYNLMNKPTLKSNSFTTADYKSFETTVFNKHFSEIKKASLKKQTLFYKELLNGKKYNDCCPEYITQAESFLKKPNEFFKNFEHLNVSVFINKNKITLKYKENNVLKSKIITLNENNQEENINKGISTDKINNVSHEIKSWDFNPSNGEKFKIILYKNDVSTEKTEEYFNYGVLSIESIEKKIESKQIIRISNSNSPYSAFEKLIVKNNFFTIEQYGNTSDYSTYEFITFKYEKNEFYLHKYSIDYTSKINPDEEIPIKNFTSKDFGQLKLENVTKELLDELVSNSQ